MPEVLAQRTFSALYIYLDILFLLFFCGLLAWRKKYMTLLFGLAGGVLYFIVDYGIFYAALHSRVIEGGSTFWVLLWMSMSYGLTNFVWIWLWLAKDKHLKEWSILILAWWICCPLIAENFGGAFPTIVTKRTTKAYHGVMALILIVGYAIVIVQNLRQPDKSKRIPLLWLLAIGILVQFGWEFSLLIGGIRNAALPMEQKIMALIVNSLVETNLGIPYIYFIQLGLYKVWQENLQRKNRPVNSI